MAVVCREAHLSKLELESRHCDHGRFDCMKSSTCVFGKSSVVFIYRREKLFGFRSGDVIAPFMTLSTECSINLLSVYLVPESCDSRTQGGQGLCWRRFLLRNAPGYRDRITTAWAALYVWYQACSDYRQNAPSDDPAKLRTQAGSASSNLSPMLTRSDW